jgi:voltage-gated potassium channel
MTDPAAVPDRRHISADRFAGPMFFLSLAFLIVLAGLFHRLPHLDPTDPERFLILGALAVLWIVFVAEAVLRFRLRDREQSIWKPLAVSLGGMLLPPLRLACRSRVRPNHIWVFGWRPIDTHLRNNLERFFSVPMVILAFMVLPLFVLEYYWADAVRAEPNLALGLDIGTSFIWLAFSVELTLMLAVAERPMRYCLAHWIDVAVVVLPAMEVLPLFRLLRLGRVLRLEQLLRAGRLYRLQALAMRGWRAILLLQIVQRVFRRSAEHHRRELRELLEAKEEEVAELRDEITKLDARMAKTNARADFGFGI